jgi:Uma2 family endonuclease
MAMQVLASTDDVPALAEVIKHRRATGLDRYDEWWDGVYRIMPDPTVAHQLLLTRLLVAWYEIARERGLSLMQGGNLGIHEVDVRCPDITVFRPDGPRTSPAYLATAELVVEALSPGEVSGAKLDFYAKWNVKEYLEIDQRASSVQLLANHAGVWEPAEVSDVLGFAVADVERLLAEIVEA